MNESKRRPVRRTHHRRHLQLTAVPAVPMPPVDWSGILESLPHEPPKSWTDFGWNAYKQGLWRKYKPDSLVGFELFRMAARSSEMPESLKLAANFLALLCVLDGYGATVDGAAQGGRRTGASVD